MADHGKQEWVTGAFIGIGLAGLGLGGALAAASGTMGKESIPVWGIAMIMVIVLIRSPLAKAFATKLTEKPSEAEGLAGDEVYGELDELRARVLELEERQDFAERMLANRSEVPEQS